MTKDFNENNVDHTKTEAWKKFPDPLKKTCVELLKLKEREIEGFYSVSEQLNKDANSPEARNMLVKIKERDETVTKIIESHLKINKIKLNLKGTLDSYEEAIKDPILRNGNSVDKLKAFTDIFKAAQQLAIQEIKMPKIIGGKISDVMWHMHHFERDEMAFTFAHSEADKDRKNGINILTLVDAGISRRDIEVRDGFIYVIGDENIIKLAQKGARIRGYEEFYRAPEEQSSEKNSPQKKQITSESNDAEYRIRSSLWTRVGFGGQRYAVKNFEDEVFVLRYGADKNNPKAGVKESDLSKFGVDMYKVTRDDIFLYVSGEDNLTIIAALKARFQGSSNFLDQEGRGL